VTARGRALLLVGPTAVGKSALALDLAERLGGEIVSLDSRQMVRGLDIGTAKPTLEERARVRHHLVDIATPDEPLPLSSVLRQVYAAVDEVLARLRPPLLVGGTGQYVRAVRIRSCAPSSPPSPRSRAPPPCTRAWPPPTRPPRRASTRAMCAASSGRSRSLPTPASRQA
jgi:tRNA dimethylallyltransferase